VDGRGIVPTVHDTKIVAAMKRKEKSDGRKRYRNPRKAQGVSNK
jgi:ribosomal protein L24E